MTDPTTQAVINQTVALIRYYGFETGSLTALELVSGWLEVFPPIWVRLATIEALYQGRYKDISVEQILAFWVRRGQPTYHFNHEFESLVCRKIPLFPTRDEEWDKLNEVLAAATIAPSTHSEAEVTPAEFLEDFLNVEPPSPSVSQEAQATESLPKKPHYRPIHKFTPSQESSDFYDKLKRTTMED
ncbi:hypothetical protein [Oscillatoria sp. FACHB-1406]|uniref:hypothetical protein n=1 Tax=Oscillatoria sp. FACHB-1406 TaxID=2692846 RepID=UPI00168A2D3E|nr:hypothetical protein [Oscillatoria sp. FACHB-1406]MBD2576443.1 hypothetical protein [Oscillatoria sp. FACHB-1406]